MTTTDTSTAAGRDAYRLAAQRTATAAYLVWEASSPGAERHRRYRAWTRASDRSSLASSIARFLEARDGASEEAGR